MCSCDFEHLLHLLGQIPSQNTKFYFGQGQNTSPPQQPKQNGYSNQKNLILTPKKKTHSLRPKYFCAPLSHPSPPSTIPNSLSREREWGECYNDLLHVASHHSKCEFVDEPGEATGSRFWNVWLCKTSKGRSCEAGGAVIYSYACV